MIIPLSLLSFDISSAMLMLLLAALSRRLGEALKIPAYFQILRITAAMVCAAQGIDVVTAFMGIQLPRALTMGVRAAAGAGAFFACLPYWKWLFKEYFFRMR